jgi:hypothetical protein
MTTALVVLAVGLLVVSALAVWALTAQLDRLRDAHDSTLRLVLDQHEEAMGLLAEELTANRAAHEDTMRMVLAGYERLVYPATVQTDQPGADPSAWPEWKQYRGEGAAQVPGARERPKMPDDPAVTGDLEGVMPDEPAFLGLPLDGIPEDALHAARVEAMYAPPVEPMPEAAGPQGAVMMDVDDPDPFGIGANERED